MAKNIARLLKTDVMADFDLKGLAQILQSRGRRGDSILAHITPEEAQRLKDEGGSGTINPETGLPEFFDDVDYAGGDWAPADVGTQPIEVYAQDAPTGDMPIPDMASQQTPEFPQITVGNEMPPAPEVATPEIAAQTGMLPTVAGAGLPSGEPAMPPAIEPSVLDRLKSGWESMTPQQKNMLLRTGLGVTMGGLSALQGRQAAKQARAAERRIADIGAPYQQQGQEQMAMARRGELTAGSQQQLQAARAALAQGVERRGGVGAQQAATQLQAFRQQLLDNQYNYGLKIAQIGDQYAQRAIQTGLTQDRDITALMQGLTAAMGGWAGAQPNKG